MLVACGQTPPPPAPAAAPRIVKALKVGAGGTAQEARYSGEVRARVETTLAFRVGGKLVARLVDVGARVSPGEPLARLDVADLTLAARQAEANRRLAEAEWRRAEALRAQNFISQAALDAKAAAWTAAEAQARLARNQAGYATLTAETAGTIAAVLAEAGQVLAAGQGVFRLAKEGEREVAIAIPESRLAGLKLGAPATVELWTGQTYPGRLRELSPLADPASRTFAARVTIVDAGPDVRLGMTATVRFASAAAEELVVPLAALFQAGKQPAVWVIGADGAVSLRPIEVARLSDAGAIVKSGLVPGETIVAAGAYLLSAGEKVQPLP